ncbi:hypothetical protein [Actinomadura flavalba]|uniref:hypothetical protein n=1 Tax=Actinomadura flavalba TaxID=1120938 RepID=UPI0003A04938|nr:hypothetical protein [Actinomadura flavalba]
MTAAWRVPGRLTLLGDPSTLALTVTIPGTLTVEATPRADDALEIDHNGTVTTIDLTPPDAHTPTTDRQNTGNADSRPGRPLRPTPRTTEGQNARRSGSRPRRWLRPTPRTTKGQDARRVGGGLGRWLRPTPRTAHTTGTETPAIGGQAAGRVGGRLGWWRRRRRDAGTVIVPWAADVAEIARRLGAGGGTITVRGECVGADAALTTGVALVLRDLYRPDWTTAELARHVPDTSVLDAVEGHARLVREGRTTGPPLPFDLATADLTALLVDTGSPLQGGRAGGDGARDGAERERAAAVLGVARLGDVEDLAAALARLREPRLRGRLQHAVTEKHRVEAAAGLLRAGALAEFGAMLNASQLSLRDQERASWPDADAAVNAAVHAGARGARITDGRVLLLVPAARADAVRDTVTRAVPRATLTPLTPTGPPTPA